MKKLPIRLIRRDGGTQSRARLDAFTIEEYQEAYKAKAEMPPIIAFYDGTDYWLADGFYRTVAAETIKMREISCDVRQGTQRDAILYSVGANATHGLRRTNEDKRRAVMMLLNDPKWAKWSDREIARRCVVDNSFVSRMRESIQPAPSVDKQQIEQPVERTVQRNGTTYQQNTRNIGHAASKVIAQIAEIEPEEETPGNSEKEEAIVSEVMAYIRKELTQLSDGEMRNVIAQVVSELNDILWRGESDEEAD